MVTVGYLELTSHGPEQTQQFGSLLGGKAKAGDVFLLVGEMATGKTCFTQGIAWGLGFTDWVASPSFVLIREYQGRLNLYHIDFYRLDDVKEITELGLEDYFYREGVSVIEWAEKALTSLPQEHMLIKFEHLTGNERQIRFEPSGRRYIELLSELRERWNLL